MKYLFILTILFACNDAQKIKDAETTGAPQLKPAESKQEATGIVEENTQCICTKEWRPVCGSNGQTYPNACQAGCEKISEFIDGPCK